MALSLNINAGVVVPLLDGELLVVHMIGWSRYILKTHDTADLNGNLAGFRAVLNYYQDKTHKVPPSKKLDRLIRLEKEGKLENELSALMKKKT